MAVDDRNNNFHWKTRTSENFYMNAQHYRMASLATLMDIRDELQTLNRLLSCTNFVNIPRTLRQIAQQTKKRKYVRKAQP
jgi:hypothetical protein